MLTASAASAQMASVGPPVRQVRRGSPWPQPAGCRRGRGGEGAGSLAGAVVSMPQRGPGPTRGRLEMGEGLWRKHWLQHSGLLGPGGQGGLCPYHRPVPVLDRATVWAGWPQGPDGRSRQAPSLQAQLDGDLGASEVRRPAVGGGTTHTLFPPAPPGARLPAAPSSGGYFSPAPGSQSLGLGCSPSREALASPPRRPRRPS